MELRSARRAKENSAFFRPYRTLFVLGGDPVMNRCICLAPKKRRWERGAYAASTYDCQQATDCSNALLLATLKRRERRAPLKTYDACATSQ